MTGKRLGMIALSALLCLGNAGFAMAGETSEIQETESETDFAGRGNGEHGGKGFGGSEGDMRGGMNQGPGGMGGMGGMDSSSETDSEITAALEEASGKFSQFTFTDPDTGKELEYSLCIPSEYSEGEEYPLVLFMPDATGTGKSASQIVEEYYGAAIWATDAEQEKHASFVLVPAFSETAVDDNWNTSDEIETVVKLIEELTQEYSLDTNRLYTTGQSAGCMTSLYLNSQYPDLFAASLFVSGQWDISVLQGLEQETFFYVTAGGDEKASGGQDEVMAMFDADGVSYSYGTWDAQNDAETQSAAAEELIEEANNANFIRFTAGSVLNGGSGMEHMASFNYAYKIEAVRDWLFRQTK